MQPKGFWSYARLDDEHLDGVLTALRKRVAGEVAMLLGHDVSIFQDTESLRTGDRWVSALREGVTTATFLVPVLTPHYFNRPWCRDETLTFLRIAREQGVEPRVFPIRFVEYDEEEGDEVREALAEFQFKDFSNWRFESDPTRQAKILHEFAQDLKARLKPATGPEVPRAPVRPGAEPPVVPSGRSEPAQPASAPRPMPEPPKFATFAVDPLHRGDFPSISAAIKAAPAGSRIVVRPGIYRESLRLSKPLELAGEGDRERIVVTTAKGHALHCDAPMARVSGMTFRREAGGEGVALWITGGAVELEDCVTESRSLSCVEITGAGTAPTLRRCVMRDGAQAGLIVHEGARPLVEDCEMVASAVSGVEVRGEGSHATLRRCVMRDGAQGGLVVSQGARPLVEDCEMVANAVSGVEVRGEGSHATLRRCVMRDGAQVGLVVSQGARPLVEDCEMVANAFSAVEVRGEGSHATLRRCVAREGKGVGFFLNDGAGGLLDRCEAVANTLSGVEIHSDADPLLRDCVLRDNNTGAFVHDGGRGRLEGCTIEQNNGAGVEVEEGGAPMVVGCTIRGNGVAAVWIKDPESGGTFEDNDMRDNAGGAWDVAEGGGDRLVRRNNQED